MKRFFRTKSIFQFLVIFSFTVVCIFYVSLYLKYEAVNNCKGAFEVGANPNNLAYIAKWFESDVRNNEKLSRLVSIARPLYTRSNPEIFKTVNLDLRSLGFDRKDGSIGFNFTQSDWKFPVDFNSVSSVSVSTGLSTVLFKVNDSKDFGYLPMLNESSNFNVLNDYVAVWCKNEFRD